MAYDFDGVDDQITHGDIAGVSGATVLTLMGYVYLDVAAVAEPLFSKWASNVGMELQLGAADATRVRVVWNNWTPNGLSAASQIAIGEWNHWAVVYNGAAASEAAKYKVYKNGVELTLTYAGTAPTTFPTTTDPLRIANEGAAGSGGFTNMKAAHIKLWLAELTAAEVMREYLFQRPSRTTDLRLWAPYDGNVDDYSGFRNHGTLTGAVAIPGPPVAWGADP